MLAFSTPLEASQQEQLVLCAAYHLLFVLQVGHPRLMEGSEAVHNTPQQALNQPQYTAADMAAEGGAPNTGGGSPQPTLNSAGPALQAQENVTTAWGVMSDDELIYQLVSRLLQQQGVPALSAQPSTAARLECNVRLHGCHSSHFTDYSRMPSCSSGCLHQYSDVIL